ncbi:hypothetical protein EJB05_43815 [Eragrostis curvula]|uniref:Bromo domain-containing protein n=1 Tax=Eragrostis curvula TaxID=38414 RepID=A0A5J9TFV0_9POAL|nr:hypothetical protein EJB05_43815 [Eragrostis curvula]
MGRQQSAAMSAPPPRKRKKKGRPSLLDLEKRSLRLEMMQEPAAARRPSTRRNPGPGSADDSDGPAAGGRREKKLRLVMGLHGESAKGEKTRKATDGRQEPSDSGPTTPLPNKKLLLFVLDRLQKKDTYGVFSEPVDAEELPDYHDIIKHPMDFSTVRKKLDKGAYSSLEQFEDDVYLISSNAMCYNSPDTIYYRQARAIQELAKKDFENLRQDSDASEPEPEPKPEPELEPEPKPQPRRGRPPNKNNVKQKVGRPPAEHANTDFSGSSPATASNSGRHAPSELELSRRAMIADVLRASFANQRNEYNWSVERKSERIEDYPGSGSKWSANGKKPLLMEDSRRSTYYEAQPSSSMYELPVSSSYNGTRKLLVPVECPIQVGVQLQQSYSRSLARFAAQLGPIGWEIASRRIERSLPSGTQFGPGWIGDDEAPRTFQPPVLASFSEAMAPPSNIVSSSELSTVNSPSTMDCAASASHLAGSQPHAVTYASTSTAQRIDSRELPVQQMSMGPGVHGVEMKGNHNRHVNPAMQQTVNGFNAVPGPMLFPSAAQLVVNQMQTHTAE